jgi:uncharacterized protein (TIGR03086 family)
VKLLDAHGAAMADFDKLVRAVPADRWDAPTPCTEWSVRDLLAHLVGEQLWVPALLAGQTVEQVGDGFDGDQLGDDPVAAWRAAADAARRAWLEPGVLSRSVHLSYGTDTATNYGWQMTLDLAVHGWDLATGIGVEYRVPDELAGDLPRIFGDVIPRWQGIGLFARPVRVTSDADPHTSLLGLLGRSLTR